MPVAYEKSVLIFKFSYSSRTAEMGCQSVPGNVFSPERRGKYQDKYEDKQTAYFYCISDNKSVYKTAPFFTTVPMVFTPNSVIRSVSSSVSQIRISACFPFSIEPMR